MGHVDNGNSERGTEHRSSEVADASGRDLPLGETLSERDKQILAFEADWSQHVGAKEEAIRLQFGVSPARYYQLLRNLVNSPAALVHDPMLIKRLQRLRDARSAARDSRRFPAANDQPHQ